MPRKAILAITLLGIVGFVVAVVRAQDSTAPDASYSIDTRTSTADAAGDAEAGVERSILASRPPIRPVDPAPSSRAISERPSSGARSPLVDRLRQVREGISSGPRPAPGPAELETLNVDGEIGNSSRRAFGETAPAIVPAPVAPPAQNAIDESDAALTSRRPVSNRLAVSSVGPALRIDTSGPRAILIGKQAEFTVTLSNQGQVAANDVYVRIGLPSWVELADTQATVGTARPQDEAVGEQRLLWTVSQLAANTQEVLRLKVTPTQNRSFDLAVDWTSRPTSAIAQIEVQQPQLEVFVFGPQDILYGETAVYTIQLTNPGTGDADDVAVEFAYGAQRLPTKQIGTLAAGQQMEISVELTARQAGQLPVAAVATAAGGLNAEASEDVLVRRAQLEIDVIGSRRKFAGAVATYQVRVQNTGNATAPDVIAVVGLPSGGKLISGSDLESTSHGLAKRIGPLAPGAERVFGVQCQLTVAGDNRLEVHAEAGADLMASQLFVTRVDALADLKLQVNDPQGPIAVGKPVSYELVVSNRGTKAAEEVTVVAQFSEGVEPIKVLGAAAQIVPGQVIFKTIPRIGAGEKLTLTITAEAEREGNHRFRAEVACTTPETKLVAEESTYFFGDDLAAPRDE